MRVWALGVLAISGWSMALSSQARADTSCRAWVDKAVAYNHYHSAFGHSPHVTLYVKLDLDKLGVKEASRVVFRGVRISRNEQTGVLGPVQPLEKIMIPFVGSRNYYEVSFDQLLPAYWNYYQYSIYEGSFLVEGANGEEVELASSVGQFTIDLRLASDLERGGQFAGRSRLSPDLGTRQLDVGSLDKTADYRNRALSDYLNPDGCR